MVGVGTIEQGRAGGRIAITDRVADLSAVVGAPVENRTAHALDDALAAVRHIDAIDGGPEFGGFINAILSRDQNLRAPVARYPKDIGGILSVEIPQQLRDLPARAVDRDQSRYVPIEIGRASCRERVCQYV